MRVRMKTTLCGPTANAREGEVVSFDDDFARMLIGAGYAVEAGDATEGSSASPRGGDIETATDSSKVEAAAERVSPAARAASRRPARRSDK